MELRSLTSNGSSDGVAFHRITVLNKLGSRCRSMPLVLIRWALSLRELFLVRIFLVRTQPNRQTFFVKRHIKSVRGDGLPNISITLIVLRGGILSEIAWLRHLSIQSGIYSGVQPDEGHHEASNTAVLGCLSVRADYFTSSCTEG